MESSPSTSLWTDLKTAYDAVATTGVGGYGSFSFPPIGTGITGDVAEQIQTGTQNPVVNGLVSLNGTEQAAQDAIVAGVSSLVPSSSTVLEYAVGIGILLVLILLLVGKLEAL